MSEDLNISERMQQAFDLVRGIQDELYTVIRLDEELRAKQTEVARLTEEVNGARAALSAEQGEVTRLKAVVALLEFARVEDAKKIAELEAAAEAVPA